MDEEAAYDRLLGACPELLADDDLARWIACFEEEGQPDRYVRLAALAHHVVSAAQQGRVDEVREVFDAAEDVLGDERADADAVELVRMGLVEPVQNICSHDDVPIDPDAFTPLLGPRTREVWDGADHLWAEAGRWAEETPRVTVADYQQVGDDDLRRYLRSARRRMPDGRLIAANDIVRYHGMVAGARTGQVAGRTATIGLWLVALAVVAAIVIIALV